MVDNPLNTKSVAICLFILVATLGCDRQRRRVSAPAGGRNLCPGCNRRCPSADVPAPMSQRHALPLILTAEFNPEQFRPVPENQACPRARQSEFNTDATCTSYRKLSVCCQCVVWRPIRRRSVKNASSLPVQLYIYRTLSLRRVIYEYSCTFVPYRISVSAF